jgi:hypothetical protein
VGTGCVVAAAACVSLVSSVLAWAAAVGFAWAAAPFLFFFFLLY